jgi:DNA-binding MarR family transcriptional regulator
MQRSGQPDNTVAPTASSVVVMDTVLLIMRTIRGEMRGHRPAGLSVPQFRTLTFLRRTPGASLSAVAEHVGVVLSSMSKLVDGLVARGLVTRTVAADDRRRVTLDLTADGHAALDLARRATLARLEERLAYLSAGEQADVLQALKALQAVFRPDAAAEDA